VSNGGYRPGAGRKRDPRNDAMAARVAAGIKPSAVAAEFDVSDQHVHAACRVRGVDCSRWRRHQEQGKEAQ
jgi:hypothetical protein